MPRRLNDLDRGYFDFIVRELKETLENLSYIEQQIVKYELTSFIAPWSDAHISHLSAMKTFSEELRKTIVSQGIAKGLNGQSAIEKGKERSTKTIKARLAKGTSTSSSKKRPPVQ